MRTILCLLALASGFVCSAQNAEMLSGTQPLKLQGDLSGQMVAGIDTFLSREIEHSIAGRQKFWKRDFSSAAAYEKSVEANRERLRKIIGATDARLRVADLELMGSTAHGARIGETDAFTIQVVRWP